MFSKRDVNAFLVSLFDKRATGSIYNGTDQNLVVLEFRLLIKLCDFKMDVKSGARSFDFEITRMISDQIAQPKVQLPLW